MGIIKQSLSDQIYEILKMDILENKIRLGSKLINRNLQERFGVSSTPVRDAINKLFQDGLISNINNAGAQVVELDYDFFLEVNEILLHVIGTGMKLSFEKHKDLIEIKKELDYYISEQKKYIGKSEYYNLDYKFHKTFIDFSYNSRLKGIYKQYNVLHEMLVRNFHNYHIVSNQSESIKMHIKIAEAYTSGDINTAIKNNEIHYKNAENIFKNMIRKS